jgi:hypothetical protein
MEERSLKTAKALLEEPEDEEELEEPVVPVELAPVAERPEPLAADVPDPDEPEEELLLEALVVPLAETTSPTWPESVTIVPSCGA